MYKNTQDSINWANNNAFDFAQVMLVPRYSTYASREDTNTSVSISDEITIQHPIIPTNMIGVGEAYTGIVSAKLGGTVFLHRFQSVEKQIAAMEEIRNHVPDAVVVGSVGIKDLDYNNAVSLIRKGANMVLVDVAHAHNEHAIRFVTNLMQQYGIDSLKIIVGNIATKEAAKAYYDLGIRTLRVGIGGGAMCRTRAVTGCGMPTLASIIDVASLRDEVSDGELYIIADGGIYESGDITKALAFGANAVCMGTRLSEASDAPLAKSSSGEPVFFGMSSTEARNTFLGDTRTTIASEGKYNYVDNSCYGTLNELFTELLGGFRSGLSYLGCTASYLTEYGVSYTKLDTASPCVQQ